MIENDFSKLTFKERDSGAGLLGTYEIICKLEKASISADVVSAEDISQIQDLQKSLKDMIAMRGSEHPLVLDGMNNLAELYFKIFQFDKAEEILTKTLVGFKYIYHNTLPIVPRTQSRLAYSQTQQRKFVDAEHYYKTALIGLEEHLGVEHPDTMNAVEWLAYTLYAIEENSKLKESIFYYERLLRYYDKINGRENQETLLVVNKLAHAYKDYKRDDDAIAICQASLEGCIKIFGKEHPTTQSSVTILAQLRHAHGDSKAAEEMYRLALECNEKTIGELHIDTISVVYLIATLLWDQGEIREAEKMYRRALYGYEKTLGATDVASFNAVHWIGTCLLEEGVLIEARQMLLRAYNGRRKLLGETHPDTLMSKYHLGKVYHLESHWRHLPDALQTLHNAETFIREAQAGLFALFGPDHNKTMNATRYLADFLIEQSKAEDAEDLFQQIFESNKRSFGLSDMATIDSAYKLGAILDLKHAFDESAALFLIAHDGYKHQAKLRGQRGEKGAEISELGASADAKTGHRGEAKYGKEEKHTVTSARRSYDGPSAEDLEELMTDAWSQYSNAVKRAND